jgi:hypothetical protein
LLRLLPFALAVVTLGLLAVGHVGGAILLVVAALIIGNGDRVTSTI